MTRAFTVCAPHGLANCKECVQTHRHKLGCKCSDYADVCVGLSDVWTARDEAVLSMLGSINLSDFVDYPLLDDDEET